MDGVRHNIHEILKLCSGDPRRWRPHVKTTKLPVVWRELYLAGIRQFKCATTRELELLLQTLHTCVREEKAVPTSEVDIILAYPVREGPQLQRVEQILESNRSPPGGPHFRISVLLEHEAVQLPPGVGWYIDLNPGMNRTGIPVSDYTAIRDTYLRQAELCSETGSVGESRFRGLHFYDGQHRQADLDERRRAAEDGYERLLEVASRLSGGQSAGFCC